MAALLHDLGRVEQYESGIPHEQAAVPVAEKIMKECGFSNNEIILITEAILSHREDNAQKKDLGALLYKADKASRLCFVCNAADKCNWADDKKNKNIIY